MIVTHCMLVLPPRSGYAATRAVLHNVFSTQSTEPYGWNNVIQPKLVWPPRPKP